MKLLPDFSQENKNMQSKFVTLILVENIEGGIKISLREGRNTILLSINDPIETDADKSRKEASEWWNEKWDTMGWLDLPDENAHKMWVRSQAYFLSTYNDDGLEGYKVRYRGNRV